MDNPQHYQPLSHALNPPLPVNAQNQPNFVPNMYQAKPPGPAAAENEQEEEEEEGEDDDDEGVVEEQLNRNEPEGQANHSPGRNPTSVDDSRTSQQVMSQPGQDTQETQQKRRPGRPRGSKNRKPRAGSARQDGLHYQSHSLQSPSALPHISDINPQNQQYYEFQWRVLNLCSEFYNAAEELVRATPPLVIAQCYQMGPGVKVDPLIMLTEAKRVCDSLLANPSQLVSQPPPVFSAVSTFYPANPPPVPVATNAVASSSKTTSTNVITNPQSFVVPLAAQPGAYPPYSVYPSGQYPTTPYYHQYYPGPYYATQAVTAVQPQQPSTSTPAPAPAPTASSSAPTPASTGTVGAWSDEETERLKKLAEDSRAVGTSGEIEWDWVVHQWGNTRTRHQILIKATQLGLKESSGRALKRRRENDNEASASGHSPSVSMTPSSATTATAAAPTLTTTQAVQPAPVIAAATSVPASSASPSHSQPTSTPAASPAMQNQQRPASSKGHHPPTTATTTPSGLPWPMPTVAANTPSPVIAAQPAGQDPQRTSYYRPRPIEATQQKTTAGPQMVHHAYIYQPNGSTRNVRENGK